MVVGVGVDVGVIGVVGGAVSIGDDDSVVVSAVAVDAVGVFYISAVSVDVGVSVGVVVVLFCCAFCRTRQAQRAFLSWHHAVILFFLFTSKLRVCLKVFNFLLFCSYMCSVLRFFYYSCRVLFCTVGAMRSFVSQRAFLITDLNIDI